MLCKGKWNVGSISIIASVLLYIFATFRQHGISWDEQFQFDFADDLLGYYRNLFSGQQAQGEIGGGFYPGFFDLLNVLFYSVSPFNRFETGHLLSSLFGWFGFIAVWRIGCVLGGERLGFFSLILLVFMPRYFGHIWFNPKDIPFAALFAWGVFFLVRSAKEMPSPRWSSLFGLGVICGLSMGVRIAGLLLLFYFGLLFFVGWIVRIREDGARDSFRRLGEYAVRGLSVAFIAYLALFPWWPALHLDPIFGPFRAFQGLHSFGYEGSFPFWGEIVSAQNAPWTYLPSWILISTPLFTLGSFFVFVACFTVLLWKRLLPNWLSWFVVLFSFGFPVFYVCWSGPVIYDGIRHYLFILPILAVLAAGGWEFFLRMIRADRVRKIALGATLILSVFPVLFSYLWLHPFYYVYFNAVVGGLSGADGHFDTEYYGLSFRESAEQLNDFVEISPLLAGSNERFSVSSSGAWWMTVPFLSQRFDYTGSEAGSDFFVSYSRGFQHLSRPGYVVGGVSRDGVVFNLAVMRKELGEDSMGLIEIRQSEE